MSALPFCCMKLFRCFLLTVSCNVYMKFDMMCKQSGAWQLVDVARWGGGKTEDQWVLLDFMVPFLHRWTFWGAVMWSACKIIFIKEKVLLKIHFALYLVIILAGKQSWSVDCLFVIRSWLYFSLYLEMQLVNIEQRVQKTTEYKHKKIPY